MSVSQKVYDVRAVRFIKTRFQSKMNEIPEVVPRRGELADYCTRNNSEYVICLSHFDYLMFDKISELEHKKYSKSPLDAIDKDREHQAKPESDNNGVCLKEDNYTYPLYMLLDVSSIEIKEKVKVFWKEKADYTSVVRIHYKGSKTKPHLGVDYFIQQMQKQGIGKYDRGIVKIAVDVCTVDACQISVDVYGLIYDSLELGDCVVILKSSSMAATLAVTQKFNQIPCVMDCYTYIGISPRLFENATEHGKSQRDKIKLASASTRFTVKTIKNAEDFFKENFGKKRPDFITGTTDAIMRWEGDQKNGLSERVFLGKISKLKPNDSKIHLAFRDVITRIGIDWDDMCSSNESSNKSVGLDYSKLFNKRDTPAIGWFSDEGTGPSWLKKDILLYLSLKKLLGAVQTMGQDGVMDDLADLLVPSLRALLSRLNELNPKDWCPEHKKTLENLLQDYYSLIQNITQLESQLVQHPEIYPVPYYIPAAVLQFELQFTKCCSGLFQDNVGTEKRKKHIFLPLLVPKYQSDASTYAPFDPNRGDGSTTTNNPISPLRINLPIKLLYKPYEAAHQLCHELAHYCGDKTRNREARFKTLRKCCAAMLMVSWEEMLGERECWINWDSSHIEDEWRYLEGVLGGFVKSSEYYLTTVEKHLQGKVREIGLNPQYYERFHNILLVDTYNNQREIIRAKIMKQQSLINPIVYSTFWYQHIAYLKDLVRECYADLAMLKLLNCKAETYCECFGESFKRHLQSNEDFGIQARSHASLKLQVDRMAFVIYVMGDGFISEVREIKPCSISIEYVLKQVRLLEKVFGKHGVDDSAETRWNGETKNESTMTVVECKEIVEYLKVCKEALDRKFLWMRCQERKKLKQLRDALRSISAKRFNWSEVQNFVWEIQNSRDMG